MRADCRVGGKLCERRKKVIRYRTSGTEEGKEQGKCFTSPIIPQRLLKIGQVPTLMGTRNHAHTLHIPHVGVVQGEFNCKKRVDVFWLLTRGRGEGECGRGKRG